MLRLLLQLATGRGTVRAAACFLLEGSSRFARNNSISPTNQPTAFCLLSLRGAGGIRLLPSAPASSPRAPQRWESARKGFLLQNPGFHVCFWQCSLYLLLRGLKLSGPQAYPTGGCWIFWGLISSLVFFTTFYIVIIITHRWFLSCGELSGQRCQSSGLVLDAAFALSQHFTTSSCELLGNNPRTQVNSGAKRTNSPAVLSDEYCWASWLFSQN